jgi:hypothetical protein
LLQDNSDESEALCNAGKTNIAHFRLHRYVPDERPSLVIEFLGFDFCAGQSSQWVRGLNASAIVARDHLQLASLTVIITLKFCSNPGLPSTPTAPPGLRQPHATLQTPFA